MNVAGWARAFVFTQIAEVPIYRYGLRASWWRAFGASAITHPIVWWISVESGWSAPWIVRAVSVETFAVVVEALWFGASRRAFLWSLIANGASFALGLLAYRWFG